MPKEFSLMDNLVSVLDSFHTGWVKKRYVKELISILKELVIPSYPSMRVEIRDNEAVFPAPWDQVLTSLKQA